MTKPLVDRASYDHPEHFDDDIRLFKSSARNAPTHLEHLLFELAGHKCTICGAPWMEVHHIDELSEGGLTEYENLIVLCPNCHTRVHSTGVPGKPELRQYKLKQELLYGLPVLSRLTKAERTFVALLAKQSPESQLLFSTKDGIRYELDSTGTPVLAQAIVDEYGSLLEFGMVSINRGICVQDSTGNLHAVDASLQVTDKGLRWVRYLVKAGKLPD